MPTRRCVIQQWSWAAVVISALMTVGLLWFFHRSAPHEGHCAVLPEAPPLILRRDAICAEESLDWGVCRVVHADRASLQKESDGWAQEIHGVHWCQTNEQGEEVSSGEAQSGRLRFPLGTLTLHDVECKQGDSGHAASSLKTHELVVELRSPSASFSPPGPGSSS
ncbi:MAG: hypothetical protein ACOYKZ_03370 [Chlamydiia bacterium]